MGPVGVVGDTIGGVAVCDWRQAGPLLQRVRVSTTEKSVSLSRLTAFSEQRAIESLEAKAMSVVRM